MPSQPCRVAAAGQGFDSTTATPDIRPAKIERPRAKASVAGSVTVSIDMKSIKDIPGVQIVSFQSHACMGPGCAVADDQPDGISAIRTGSQKPNYAVRWEHFASVEFALLTSMMSRVTKREGKK